MLKKYSIALAMLILSSNSLAQWNLVTEESTIDYVSIKISMLGEFNTFNQFTGAISDNGKISIDIDLASVDTNVPVRDERMKTMFFETDTFSHANINTEVDPKILDGLEVGETYSSAMNFNLSLHGISKDLVAEVNVVKLAQNRILVLSMKPIIVNAEQFDLAEGIEMLREAAGLPSISTAVPVTFSLVFAQKQG